MQNKLGKTYLNKLQKRDPQTVQSWFLEYADRIYTFVFFRVGKDENQAADLVQEIFAKALGKLDQFDPERTSMYSWLIGLGRNCLKKHYRENARFADGAFWGEVDSKLLAAYQKIDSEPLPPEILEKQETKELVQTTLSNIPHPYQQVLQRRYIQGESTSQIARHLQITETAVRSLLYRSRKTFIKAFLIFAQAKPDTPCCQEFE